MPPSRLIGTQGWHVDGAHEEKPTGVAIYHIVSAAEGGDTGKFIACVDAAKRSKTEQGF
jgi:hypothetical protein